MTIKAWGKNQLNAAFWDAYEDCWSDAAVPCPFYSPNYLRSWIARKDEISIFVGIEKEQYVAILALWQEKGTLRFLADENADHNVLIYRKSIPEEVIRAFFKSFLKEIKGLNLFFHNIPQWEKTTQLLLGELKKAKLPFKQFEAWDNPSVEYEEGAELEKPRFLQKKFNKGNIRNYHNKLKKKEGFAFEVYQELDEDFESWLEEFCNNHELRWNQTDTPSAFRFQENRELLKDKLKAWDADKVLLRFSILSEGRRLAFAICLREEQRLIYHLITYAPDHSKSSATAVLIMLIGRWMLEREFEVFDFGSGGESYKFRYANKNIKLLRIYAGSSRWSLFWLKASFDERLRSNETWQKYWYQLLKNKNKWTSRIDTIRLFIKRNKGQLLRNPIRFLLQWYGRKSGAEQLLFYVKEAGAEEVASNTAVQLVPLSIQEVLAMLDEQLVLSPKYRAQYLQHHFENIRKPYGLKKAEKIVQISWLQDANPTEVPPGLEGFEQYKSIVDCYTPPDERGNGYYPTVLKLLSQMEKANTAMIIYTHDWNVASQKGIQKAGFSLVAKKKIDKQESNWISVEAEQNTHYA